MSIQNLTGIWKRDDRFHILAGQLILSVMLTCMVVSVVQVGELIFQGFNGAYLVGLGFLVSIEAILSHRAIKGSSMFDPEWLLFRGTELVVILLAVKLAYYAQYGLDQLLIDAPRWLQDFLYAFMTPEYGFGCLVMALVWALSTGLAESLDRLYVDTRILRQEAESGIFEDRNEIREHLVGALLAIGLGMIVMAALLRSSGVMSWADLPVMRLGVTNLLVYFLLFLVLLSLTQFSLMRTNWLRDRLVVGEQIPKRWLLDSFILILGLTLIARLLPTGYSIGLLAALNYLISLAIVIIYELITFLVAPVLLLVYWLLSLFKTSSEPLPPVQMPSPPPLPPAIPQASTIPWLEAVKSILFWAILFVVVGYSLVYYIRERRDLLDALRRLPFAPALGRFWRWLERWLGGARRGVSSAIEAGLERLRSSRRSAAPNQVSSYLSLRRMSPRRRVQFYYLAMVRRGGEAGLERKPAETPYHYATSLSQSLVELATESQPASSVKEDINELTEKFLEARYSLHTVTTEEAGLVKKHWEKIRRALSRRQP
jgi:hypothetical protein